MARYGVPRGAGVLARGLGVLLLACLCDLGLPGSSRAQEPPAPSPQAPAAPAPAAASPGQEAPAAATSESAGVPVTFRGRELYRLYAGFGALDAAERARVASERIRSYATDPAFDVSTIAIVDTPSTTEIRASGRLIGIVTNDDAAGHGRPRREVAETIVATVVQAIDEDREAHTARALLTAIGLAVLATLVFVLVVWGLNRLAGRLRRRLIELGTRGFLAFQFQRLDFISPDQGTRMAVSLVRLAHVVAVVTATFSWLEAVLAALPWSRPYARRLVPYVLDPLGTIGQAVLDFLPDLFAIGVIVALIAGMLRLVRFFFRQVQVGRLEFEGFPAEWALPTYKLVRVFLVAVGVVMAYPYIPGSKSPAFQGVTLLVGFLLSLASSSALSNIIAGTILTYTRAFRLGDRVRIGETVGDVVATSLLVTDVRTIKNVVVAIPNAIVLTTPIVNYSRLAREDGLILNTSVTIGYDAPWRTVHELLIGAARATPGIEATPAPFVLQTALNDFYVSYEINAYTRRPNVMDQTYADLHAQIQDAFNAAGVEIMSPHYASLRDGNTVTIPEGQRPPGYQAPGFRVTAPSSR